MQYKLVNIYTVTDMAMNIYLKMATAITRTDLIVIASFQGALQILTFDSKYQHFQFLFSICHKWISSSQ